MAGKKVIAILQSGGEFETNQDGSLSYRGGDAHAREIDENMKYKDFKREIEEIFSSNHGTMSIKYFLPDNKKTLITISGDKDLSCMIKFHANSSAADIYVIMKDDVAADVSNMSASRSSRTTFSGAGISVDPPFVVDNAVDDNVIVDDITHVNAHMDSPTDMPPHLPSDGSTDVPPFSGAGVSVDPPEVVDDVVDDNVILDDITHVDALMHSPADMPPALPSYGSTATDVEKPPKAAKEWQNKLTGVGQRFNSVGDFREALCQYAIAHQFTFIYVKNETSRVTAKCKEQGCSWFIHARKLPNIQVFRIRKMNVLHTCKRNTMTTVAPVMKNVFTSIIKEKMKGHPNYKPKDIISEIKQEYGLQLTYRHVWNRKKIAKEQLHGSSKAAYSQVPDLCEEIMETNPGSIATFTTKENSSFHGLFVSFHASLYGFQQGCRPLLFLDSTPLKSKYQGTWLAATAADGADKVFPVAFAVVDAETDENWHWFLVQLKSAFSTALSITFVADREKGLMNSISDVFHGLDVHHGYCIRYLSEQLIRDLNGQYSNEVKCLMVEDFYAAASAPRPKDFERCVQNIRRISIDAYKWVMQSEPLHWANSYFQGARYNHLTANFGELFYSWASEAHELPITAMVNTMWLKVMELMYTRRVDSNQWRTRLTPSMEEKLEKERLKVVSLRVTISGGNKFEVRGESGNNTEDVDLDQRFCSCKRWQLTGLPCCHAIAVINCLGCQLYDYCSRYLTTDSYKLTYSELIHPVPSIDRPMEKESSNSAVTITPPPHRRQAGRPSAGLVGSQRSVKRKRLP